MNLQELELKLKQEIEIQNEYKTLPTLMNKSTILKEEHLRKVTFLKKLLKRSSRFLDFYFLCRKNLLSNFLTGNL